MTARKPDTNRQVLIICEPCEYRLRGSRATLARGVPACPCCAEPMELAQPSVRDRVAASLLTPERGTYL